MVAKAPLFEAEGRKSDARAPGSVLHGAQLH